MSIRKNTKEYDKICLCWSFYQYMCDNLVEDNTIEGFLIAYNLIEEELLNIAIKEGYTIDEKHIKNVSKDLKNRIHWKNKLTNIYTQKGSLKVVARYDNKGNLIPKE